MDDTANKSAASAASPDYVKFQTVIKSAASAASPHRGRASGRLDHGDLFAIFGPASGPKIFKISDSAYFIAMRVQSSQCLTLQYPKVVPVTLENLFPGEPQELKIEPLPENACFTVLNAPRTIGSKPFRLQVSSL